MRTDPPIPTEATIGPHTYRIVSDEDTSRHLHDDGARGDSQPDRNIIRVDATLPHTQAAETLLHELLHCCWQRTGLRAFDPDGNEEVIVTALAPQLLDLLRRSPDVVAYLTR